MITKFKLFEDRITVVPGYENKFFVQENYSDSSILNVILAYKVFTNDKHDYSMDADLIKTKNNNVYDVPIESFPMGKYNVRDTSFDWGPTGAIGWSYTKDEFDKIEFMSPSEFYKKYTVLCANLYIRIIDDLYSDDKNNKKRGYTKHDSYIEVLNKFDKVLEDVPELYDKYGYLKSSIKYNL